MRALLEIEHIACLLRYILFEPLNCDRIQKLGLSKTTKNLFSLIRKGFEAQGKNSTVCENKEIKSLLETLKSHGLDQDTQVIQDLPLLTDKDGNFLSLALPCPLIVENNVGSQASAAGVTGLYIKQAFRHFLLDGSWVNEETQEPDEENKEQEKPENQNSVCLNVSQVVNSVSDNIKKGTGYHWTAMNAYMTFDRKTLAVFLPALKAFENNTLHRFTNLHILTNQTLADQMHMHASLKGVRCPSKIGDEPSVIFQNTDWQQAFQESRQAMEVGLDGLRAQFIASKDKSLSISQNNLYLGLDVDAIIGSSLPSETMKRLESPFDMDAFFLEEAEEFISSHCEDLKLLPLHPNDHSPDKERREAAYQVRRAYVSQHIAAYLTVQFLQKNPQHALLKSVKKEQPLIFPHNVLLNTLGGDVLSTEFTDRLKLDMWEALSCSNRLSYLAERDLGSAYLQAYLYQKNVNGCVQALPCKQARLFLRDVMPGAILSNLSYRTLLLKDRVNTQSLNYYLINEKSNPECWPQLEKVGWCKEAWNKLYTRFHDQACTFTGGESGLKAVIETGFNEKANLFSRLPSDSGRLEHSFLESARAFVTKHTHTNIKSMTTQNKAYLSHLIFFYWVAAFCRRYPKSGVTNQLLKKVKDMGMPPHLIKPIEDMSNAAPVHRKFPGMLKKTIDYTPHFVSKLNAKPDNDAYVASWDKYMNELLCEMHLTCQFPGRLSCLAEYDLEKAWFFMRAKMDAFCATIPATKVKVVYQDPLAKDVPSVLKGNMDNLFESKQNIQYENGRSEKQQQDSWSCGIWSTLNQLTACFCTGDPDPMSNPDTKRAVIDDLHKIHSLAMKGRARAAQPNWGGSQVGRVPYYGPQHQQYQGGQTFLSSYQHNIPRLSLADKDRIENTKLGIVVLCVLLWVCMSFMCLVLGSAHALPGIAGVLLWAVITALIMGVIYLTYSGYEKPASGRLGMTTTAPGTSATPRSSWSLKRVFNFFCSNQQSNDTRTSTEQNDNQQINQNTHTNNNTTNNTTNW